MMAVSTALEFPLFEEVVPVAVWQTPAGMRLDLGEGRYVVWLKGGAGAYAAVPEKKQVIKMPHTVEEASDYFRRLLEGRFHLSKFTGAVRYEAHLGRRCRIESGRGVFRGQPIQAQVWTTEIAGRRVILRLEAQFPKNKYFLFEVTRLDVYAQMPKGLLGLPVGYTVVAPPRPVPQIEP